MFAGTALGHSEHRSQTVLVREQRWGRWASSPPARLLVASLPWIVVMVDEFANWKNSNIVTIAWPVSSEVMGDTSSLGVHVAGLWLHNDYHVHHLSFIATTCQYCRIYIYMLKLLLGQWIQRDPTSHRDSSSQLFIMNCRDLTGS